MLQALGCMNGSRSKAANSFLHDGQKQWLKKVNFAGCNITIFFRDTIQHVNAGKLVLLMHCSLSHAQFHLLAFAIIRQ
jgi:hypothetical protein